MKKFFTLIAVATLAIGAQAQSAAQTIDYTSMKATDFTVANATKNTSGSTDSKSVYDIEGGQELAFSLNTATNVVFTITNGSNKQKIFSVNFNTGENTDKGLVEFGGKNGVVIFKNAQVGDVIKMNVAAKGSTDGVIGVLPSSGNELIGSTKLDLPSKSKGAEGADADGYIWKEFSFTVTEDMLKTIEEVKVVRVKETDGGYRCKAVAINAGLPTGINTVKAAETENGAAYNIAGQKVADGFKGVVIKNGRKMIQK